MPRPFFGDYGLGKPVRIMGSIPQLSTTVGVTIGAEKTLMLDTRTFDSKGAAKLFFRRMLNRYRPGDQLSDEDALDLEALLRLHTEAEQKVGVGIGHFEVMTADYGTKCFRIVRIDGSSDDFSYIHCITPKSS